MRDENKNLSTNSLDVLKCFCTILIVGSHSLPLFSNEFVNILYSEWFFRFCVPLFFISSGYFFSKMNNDEKIRYLKRILSLYLISTLLYLPFILRIYLLRGADIFELLKYFLFGYGHLWYLSALFIGLLFWNLLRKIQFIREVHDNIVIAISFILLFLGAFFDEYYHLFDGGFIMKIGLFIDNICSTRSALFMGLPLLLLGRFIQKNQNQLNLNKKNLVLFFILSTILSLIEFLYIFNKVPYGYSLTCDLTFFNWIPALVLFIIAIRYTPFKINKAKSRMIRKLSDFVYIIHLIVIFFCNTFFNSIKYIKRFVLVLIISYIVAYISFKLKEICLKNIYKS